MKKSKLRRLISALLCSAALVCTTAALCTACGETDGESGPTTYIVSVEKSSTDGNVDTYTVTFSDGSTYDFDVTNGVDGEDGEDGKDFTAHEHAFAVKTVVEPSCNHIGFTLKECGVCGMLTTEDEQPMIDHAMEQKLLKLNGKAVRTSVCTRCGHSESEDISADYTSKYRNLTYKQLDTFREEILVHSVGSGRDTATSYWAGKYGETGVDLEILVLDPVISLDSSDIGYSDNVEFHIQAVDSCYRSFGFERNFLCTADGKIWLRTLKSSAMDYEAYEPGYGDFSYSHERFDGGYRVTVHFGYSELGVTREEALGKVRIYPGLRNRSGNSQGFSWFELLGAQYDHVNTWFVLDEDNAFVRKDFEPLVLSDSSVGKTAIENLATLVSADERYTFHETVLGTNAFYNSQLCFQENGLADDLFGTSFLRGPKVKATAEVEKAGYVVALARTNGGGSVENTLIGDGWTCLARNVRNPFGVSSQWTNVGNLYLVGYYAKYFEAGETITMPDGTQDGDFSVLFCANENTEEDPWFTKPAYISRSAVGSSIYLPEVNTVSCGASLAATAKGRLIAMTMFGGDTTINDSQYLAYSDDGGKNWKPLFVVDTWNDMEIGTSKDTVQFDGEVFVDPDTNVLYITYNQRRGVSAAHEANSPGWMFCVQNPDDDPAEWLFNNEPDGSGEKGWHTIEDAEQIGKCLPIGWIRNRWTRLSDGSYIVVPNYFNEPRFNPVWKSEDKGKTWERIGEIYMPQAMGFDEARVVELTQTADGGEHVLWATFRCSKGLIAQSFSYDGGKNWTIGSYTNIVNPDSRFDIARLKSGKLLLVHSDHGSSRIGMTVAISEDDGKSFQNKLCLYTGVASYPEIAFTYDEEGNETIHIAFDDGRYLRNQWRTEADGNYLTYAYIYHVALTEEEIMAGGDPSADKTELLAVGDSYTDNNRYWTGFDQAFGIYGGKSIGVSGTKVAYWNNETKLAEIAGNSPEKIFVNIGINDIDAGTAGTKVGNDVVSFLEALHEKLPGTDIYYNMMLRVTRDSLTKFHAQVDAANAIIRAYIEGDTHGGKVHMIDIMPTLTLPSGETDTTKFADGLHLTTEGYAILNEAITKATGIGRSVETLDTVYRCGKFIGTTGTVSGNLVDVEGNPVTADVKIVAGGKTFERKGVTSFEFPNVLLKEDAEILITAEGYYQREFRLNSTHLDNGEYICDFVLVPESANEAGEMGGEKGATLPNLSEAQKKSAVLYKLYLQRTSEPSDGIRAIAIPDRPIPDNAEFFFLFSVFSATQARNGDATNPAVGTFLLQLNKDGHAFKYCTHPATVYSNDDRLSSLRSDGTMMFFMAYASMTEQLASVSGIEDYSVSEKSPIRFTFGCETVQVANENSGWSIEQLPAGIDGAEFLKYAQSRYKTDKASNKQVQYYGDQTYVNPMMVYAYPVWQPDGSFTTQDKMVNELDAAYFNTRLQNEEVLREDKPFLDEEGNVQNMAKVTVDKATVAKVEKNAFMFTQETDEAIGSIVTQNSRFTSADTPTALFGLGYVRRECDSTNGKTVFTVKAETDGYVFLLYLSNKASITTEMVATGGWKRLVENVGGCGGMRNGAYCATYCIYARFMTAGESVNILDGRAVAFCASPDAE